MGSGELDAVVVIVTIITNKSTSSADKMNPFCVVVMCISLLSGLVKPQNR